MSIPLTPIWLARERMMLIVSASVVESTGRPEVVRAWKISSVPPCRSRPRWVFCALTTPGMPTVTTSDTSTSAVTSARTKALRARSLIGPSAGRCEHEQQSAVVVVCREEVGGRARGEVGVGPQRRGLPERPHPPLEDRRDVILAVLEAQPELLRERLTDDLLLLIAGQLERSPAAADHATLAVGHEERRVRRRVVVVEQLEEKREAAVRAAPIFTAKRLIAVRCERAVAAVGADEWVRHRRETAYMRSIGERSAAGARNSEQRRRHGRWRDVEVRVRVRGRGPPARRPLEHPQLQQVGLIDILDRVALLAHRDGQRRQPHGATGELLTDRPQDLAIEPVQ